MLSQKLKILRVRVSGCYCCGKKLVAPEQTIASCYKCSLLSYRDLQEGLIIRFYAQRESMGKSCITEVLTRELEAKKLKRARASQVRYDNLCKAKSEKRWPYQLGLA